MSEEVGGAIGIVGVVRELDELIDTLRLKPLTTEESPLGRFHRGRLRDRDVAVVETGIGKVCAAMGTQALIDRVRPRCLIFSGTAGALSDDLAAGDLVVPASVAVHDVGAWRASGFRPSDFALLDGKAARCCAHRLHADARLRELAVRAAAGLSGQAAVRLHGGTVVTGDQVIFSAEMRRWLREHFGAVAVEMEGAAFAQTAAANRLPWLLIRGISDGADHRLDFPFEAWLDYVDEPRDRGSLFGRGLARVRRVAADPAALLRARRFLANSRLAAANAVRLTEATVELL